MSRLPLFLVLLGILLSLLGFKLGSLIWAGSPIVVYVIISTLKRKELGIWTLVGYVSSAVAIISYLMRELG
ncbi:MAG: hypothetical protein GXO39_08995 [Thermotogae bacterium]|nr:hypothetical protein [Thermotogota bacterium]